MLEIAWSIYGNTFIYDDGNCEDEYADKFGKDVSIDTLHTTAEVLIIYGYLLMLALLLWGLFYLGVYCGWKGFYTKDQEHIKSLEDRKNNYRTSDGNFLTRAKTVFGLDSANPSYLSRIKSMRRIDTIDRKSS